MKSKSLTEMQEKILAMMKWFHQLCVENNITYYMVGGTMLGAVRHKGFIPWDDDIDVGLPRKDFDKLLEVTKNNKLNNSKHNKYIIESYKDGNEDFEYPYAKVYDTTTTLIENKRKHPKRGVYIDVFPLDGIGTDAEDAAKNYNPILLKLDLLNVKICGVRKGRSRFKNAAVRVAGIIPDSLLNSKRLIGQLEKLCKQRDFYECAYVGNLVGNWGKKELMPYSAFGMPKLYTFEDTAFYGVENYDNYLKHLYGDWEKLPPKEKQKSHHDYVKLNLFKSYLE